MNRIFRKEEKGVSPVIAVILMVAITVVLAGVLWAMLSGMDFTTEPTDVNITTHAREKGNVGWQITIDSVNGNLRLDEARFRFVDSDNIQQWERTVNDANPPRFQKGESYVYAIPSGSAPVRDNETGSDVSGTSLFEKYELCYMAYIDSDHNQKVSSGDAIWIYKDYDSDGVIDYRGTHKLEIKDPDNTLAGSESL